VQTHFDLRLCGLNCGRPEIPHPHQVVSGGREGKDPTNFEDAAMPDLPHERNGLQPSEALFNSLPLDLADPIAGVPDCSRINRAPARPIIVLRHMRGNVHVPTLGDEALGVVSLVACH